MTYATIMTHVELGRGSAKRTKLAADFASAYDATLIGMAAVVPADMPVFQAKPSEVLMLTQDTARLVEGLADTKVQFLAATRHVPHVLWREGFDFPTETLLREARAADLIVIGREHDPSVLVPPLDTARFILQAGRPVLLVPLGIDYLQASRVLVGWKDTRESRHAVREAIPILQKAKEVILIEACSKGDENAALERLADVEGYLGRHGVGPCTRYYVNNTADTAAELIRVAQDEGAGLIVAGAYGHTRLGEWAFGGVTRELLSSSPLCCLLSH